jgi:hypothetical protein
LLRMSDLLALQPNLDIRLYVARREALKGGARDPTTDIRLS